MKVCCDICNLKTKEYKVILTKQLSGVVMCDKCSEDNTKESLEEQIEWLKKIAEQKEINKMVDEVEGTLTKPQGSLLLERKHAKFNPMIKLRTDFDDEMEQSVKEIK